MMTNSVANNGNPCGAMDYRLHKGEILETGTKVLEYDGGISYHGKCFTVTTIWLWWGPLIGICAAPTSTRS